MLTLGRVEAFESRCASAGDRVGRVPIELRRIGVEVRFPTARSRPSNPPTSARGLALPRVRADEHARRAPRAPCPRCIRRSRIDYERSDELGRRWRRLRRKLRELDRVATPFSAPLPGLP